MVQKEEIVKVLQEDQLDRPILVMGWVRSFRNNQFIALNDGSTNNNLQIVVNQDIFDADVIKKITTGAAISVEGTLVASQGKGQKVEVVAAKLTIFGECDGEKYPLQLKNRPSLEYLREISHLRFRTNTFGAVFRVRHALAFSIHQFFNDRGFFCLHSPIITGSDAEGAGEMFRVTTLPMDNLPKNEAGEVDYSKDFFAKQTNLTVSGQLEAELAATALGKVYTFGPTFRAENSNTSRHLAEFWMIEPEVAFVDIHNNMDLAEDLLQHVIRYALKNCSDDLVFLNQRLEDEEKQKPQQDRMEMGLLEKLEFVVANKFERITYTEAIDILLQSAHYKKKKIPI